MEIIKKSKRPHPFNENGPGKSWWERFMRDHSGLSFRVPQALNEARAQRANPIIVNDYFKKLKEIIEKYSLTADRIWNMDETGFVLNPELCKVIAKKGARQVK